MATSARTTTASHAPAHDRASRAAALTSESSPRMTELSPPAPLPATATATTTADPAGAGHRHLPDAWVDAYARGELSGDLLAHAEAHLERCRACVDAVDLAVRGGPYGPRLDALHRALVNRIG